jgi:hypothetical protein
MRVAAAVLLASAAAAALPVSAATAPKPRPSELWSKYPAGRERIETAPAERPRRQAPGRPANPTRQPVDPAPQTPPRADSGGPAAAVTAVTAGVVVLLAVVLVVRVRRLRRPARPAAEGDGARRAQEVRGQLAAVLGHARAARPARTPVVARAGPGFDTVRARFPQGRNTVSSEPENRTNASADAVEEVKAGLETRVAGIVEAAKQAAEQIRTDARNEAASIRREVEEAAAARSRAADQEAERLRTDAEREAGELRRRGEGDASQRRREVEEQARKALADADAQARATREAAAEMAKRIEGSARAREATLQRETEPYEMRLRQALTGLRELTSQLEELVGTPGRSGTEPERGAEASDDNRVQSA